MAVIYSSKEAMEKAGIPGIVKKPKIAPTIAPTKTTSPILKTPRKTGTVIYSSQNAMNNAGIPGIVKPTTPVTPVTQTPPVQPIVQQPLQQQPMLTYENFQSELDKRMQQYINNVPKYEAPQPYQSTISPQIMETLNRINQQTQQGFQFDPNNAGLNQMQDQAIQKVRQDLARRGRVFDQYGAIKEQEAAQQLIPDAYRLQRADYDKDLGNLGNVLGYQTGLDQTGYGRFQDLQGQQRALEQSQRQDYTTGLQYGQEQAQTQRNVGMQNREIGLQNEQIAQQQEVSKYGVALSPTMRQYEQTYQAIPQQEIARMMPYQANFAGRINELMAINPNHPDIPILQTLRAMKVLSDPQLLSQYGAEYGMQSGAIGEMAKGQVQEQVLNELEVMKQYLSNENDIATIEKIQAEVQKIESEREYKDTQTIGEEYKALQEAIKATSLPNEIQAEINRVVAQTSQAKASAEASRASAANSYSSSRLNQERAMTEQATRGLKQQEIKTDIERKQTELEMLKEKDRLDKQNKNSSGIGLQDIYDTYDGKIDEFLKNEGPVYQKEEIKDIIDAYSKIEKLDKEDLFSELMAQMMVGN